MKYWPLIAIVLLGLFFRAYKPVERYNYAHDSDLASWMVKDIVVDRHIRLIGQLTSAPGIFIGPLFYYSLIPFYFIGQMDPLTTLGYSWLVAILTILSCYAVIYKIHGKKSAIISSFLLATSFAISLTEREVVPTTPVILWTIWAYYAINRRKLVAMSVLLALVWHINLALILLAPLFVISVLSNYKNIHIKDLVLAISVFVLLSLPLFTFEFRHNYNQGRALFETLTHLGQSGSEVNPVSFLDKILHVLDYADKNVNNNMWSDLYRLPKFVLPIFLIIASIWLAIKKFVPRYFPYLVILWQALFVIFFTLHPINLSEYYLNGMNIIWIIILGILLARLPKIVSIPFLSLFLSINFISLLNYRSTSIGYLQKKALVNYIKQDSLSHDYPCISISYMTDIGYNFGYRYIFYLANLHVNQPKSGSPVYTIVFPHSRADHLDRTFGSLGVINPDYSKYSPKEVKMSCAGENANLTDPMFGFTN